MPEYFCCNHDTMSRGEFQVLTVVFWKKILYTKDGSRECVLLCLRRFRGQGNLLTASGPPTAAVQCQADFRKRCCMWGVEGDRIASGLRRDVC